MEVEEEVDSAVELAHHQEEVEEDLEVEEAAVVVVAALLTKDLPLKLLVSIFVDS